MATGNKSDVITRLQLSLPKQWFQTDGTVIGAILGALATSWAWAYSLYAYIKLQSRILTATDGWLDVIAGDFFGSSLTRKASQSDASFRAAIIINLFRERATRKAIVTVLTQLTGRAPMIIEPQRPADTGAYGAAVAVTRSSIASYYDASGVLQYAPPNQVRYSYNPASLGAAPTLLIENAETNLFLYSEEFDNAGIVKLGTTISANTAISPDGRMTADLMVESVGNNIHYEYEQVSPVPGSVYTYSCHYKMSGRRYARVSFVTGSSANGCYCDVDLQTGTIINSGALGTGTFASARISPAGAGFYKVSVSGSVPSSTAYVVSTLRDVATNVITEALQWYVGDGVSGAYLWGAQFRTGVTDTSYIPTTSAAATRAADTLVSNMTPGSAALGGYGQAGAYGSQLIPYQAFVKAYRPVASGIPMIAGYGNAPAAYGVPSQGGEYASISMVQGAVQDADIYAAIDSVKPAGSTLWAQIGS
jgi:hypothetical protein